VGKDPKAAAAVSARAAAFSSSFLYSAPRRHIQQPPLAGRFAGSEQMDRKLMGLVSWPVKEGIRASSFSAGTHGRCEHPCVPCP
jgi:hypothetical protein